MELANKDGAAKSDNALGALGARASTIGKVAAGHVDRIFRGEFLRNLPVGDISDPNDPNQRFDFWWNTDVAGLLGISLPGTVTPVPQKIPPYIVP